MKIMFLKIKKLLILSQFGGLDFNENWLSTKLLVSFSVLVELLVL